MKRTLYLFCIMLLSFCKAQTPIIDNYGNQPYGSVNNAYYKDVNGFLNQYVGTWLYTNGNDTLKIVFQKREEKYMPGIISYYEDMLVGEYQYIENGVEKVNTLSQINTDFSAYSVDMRLHNLIEKSCLNFPQTFPKCNECFPNEKRLEMGLSDPNFAHFQNLSNSFVIRKFVENGVTKLKIWFVNTITSEPTDENGNPLPFNGYNLPFGQYILTKVN